MVRGRSLDLFRALLGQSRESPHGVDARASTEGGKKNEDISSVSELCREATPFFPGHEVEGVREQVLPEEVDHGSNQLETNVASG